jgi:hypothetical protein
MQMEPDICASGIFEAATAVIETVRSYTADEITANAILSAASAGFRGGFSHSVEDRLRIASPPSQDAELRQVCPRGA